MTKYFELVQKEYEEMYSENQALRAQLQQARRLADTRNAYDMPADRMEAIALALIDAETEARRIVNNAREKAWQIITDAKKGLPASEASEKAPLPMSAENFEKADEYQPQEPSAVPEPESLITDIDALIASIMSENRSGGE